MPAATGSPRVVSLVPSATETLRAWGVEPVACTRFCEQPDLPTVGGTKDPDVAAIAALAPDLVVVDREENRREDHDALVDAGLAVHVLHVVDLAGLDEQMAALAEAVDRTLGAARAVARAARCGPGLGADLAAALDGARRAHLRVGGPAGAGHRQRRRGRRPLPRARPGRRGRAGPRPRGGAERALPVRRAPPGRAGGAWHRPGSSTGGTCCGGESAPPAPSSASPRSSR